MSAVCPLRTGTALRRTRESRRRFARSSLLKQAVQPMSRQDTDQPSGKDKGKEKDGENASPIADDWDVDFGANSFGELTTEKRILLAIVIFIKLCLVVGALYFFICALSFMATGFRLVSCSSSSVAWVGVVPAAVAVPCPHPTSLPPPHPPSGGGQAGGRGLRELRGLQQPRGGPAHRPRTPNLAPQPSPRPHVAPAPIFQPELQP